MSADGTDREDAAMRVPPDTGGRRSPHIASQRRIWTWVLVVVTLAQLAISGFLNGTIEWDVPWPATEAEQTVFDAARYLLWSGWVGIAATGIFAGLSRTDLTAPKRVGFGLAAATMTSVVGLLVVVSAYHVGREYFLFALTR